MQTLIHSDYADTLQQNFSHDPYLLSCLFLPKWKQKKLWIQLSDDITVATLPTEDDKEWLVRYLSRSPIEAVCLHSNLGEVNLDIWAEACRIAGKPAFLRLSSNLLREGKQLPAAKNLYHRLNQIVNQGLALALLLIFSPLIMALILLIWSQYNQPILTREWCVGERGRIFQLLTFNMDLPFNLSQLPNLISVFKGDILLQKGDRCSLQKILCF